MAVVGFIICACFSHNFHLFRCTQTDKHSYKRKERLKRERTSGIVVERIPDATDASLQAMQETRSAKGSISQRVQLNPNVNDSKGPTIFSCVLKGSSNKKEICDGILIQRTICEQIFKVFGPYQIYI